jgi:competence protein ComEA
MKRHPRFLLSQKGFIMRVHLRQALAALAVLCLASTTGAPFAVSAEPAHPVDINTASVAELTTLPGIGESKAKAIVEYRAADPFKTVEDLKKVQGIGDKTFEVLRPQITVASEPKQKVASEPKQK